MIKKFIKNLYWVPQKHMFIVGAMLLIVSGLIINMGSGCALHFFTSRDNHDFAVECRSLGEKINKDVIPKDASSLDPEFYYNPKLKKCFYCGGYNKDGYIAKFIIDAYTNKEISSSVLSIKEPNKAQTDSVAELEKRKQELFNEK